MQNETQIMEKQEKNGNRFQTVYGTAIDNLGRHLIGRILSLELVNNKTITGKLVSYGQYDLMVVDSRTGQSMIIMKSAIISVIGDLSPKPTNSGGQK